MIAKGARLKDRYRLERLLGRGGMASVWLADDKVLERPVAIKVLSDTIASDPEFLARFRREARVAAGLSHPNLIGVYDYAEADERPYLVMEYVAGENLAERTSRDVAIDCEQLARELLGALDHIHAAGIVHRDVKPQNVLIAADGSAKLIDFGIALPQDATALTRTGHLLGTARFIAPEVMSGAPATERSDLYSCGIVLRECHGGDPGGRLHPLIERLTSPDPRRRPASARAAAAELDRGTAIRDQPTERFDPIPRPPTEPFQPPPPPRSRGRRTGALAAVVAAAVAVGGLAFLTLGNEGEESPGDRPAAESGSAGGAGAGETADPGQAADSETTDAGEPEASAAVPEPAGDDLALGSSLNRQGFELIQAGNYEEAVPVLEEAVRTFPPGTTALDYAYALFNLGNALRLSGRPEEAIPVLERRLEIPNQTETVRQELTAAESEAGR
jgi:eukaryotic-like serine/threonine-protein kinase